MIWALVKLPNTAYVWIPTFIYLAWMVLYFTLRRKIKSELLQTISLPIDVFMATFIVHIVGSATVVVSVYFAIVAGYVMTRGRRLRFAAYLISALFYVGLHVLEGFEIIGIDLIPDRYRMLDLPQYNRVFTSGFVLILLTTLYGFLEITLRSLEKSVQRERELLARERESHGRWTRIMQKFDETKRLESLGRLAGGVAHDFNNMLTGIIGYVRLVDDNLPEQSPAREDLAVISHTAERAGRLTAQLLAFSRKQIMSTKLIDLNNLVRKMTEIISRTIGENIRVETATDERLDPINSDPAQIEQCILNLALNARDAMPNGGKLTIRTYNISLNEDSSFYDLDCPYGEYVVLTVEDNGLGMDKETKAHIFEPFFTTKRVGEGTGLGLATVYGTVKQNKGTIQVDSKEGIGTRFLLYFPRAMGAIRSSAPPALTPKKRAKTKKQTILLAEDEEIVRRSAARILSGHNYHMLIAESGEEALDIAEQYDGTIELLLTDVVMTGISGKELADRITLKHPKTHVLYMSGYTEDAIVKHGVLDKGTNFLGKPFTANLLLSRVREILDSL